MDNLRFLNDLDEYSLDLRISLLHSCFQQANYKRIITELPSAFCNESNRNPRKPDFVKLKSAVHRFGKSGTITDIKRSWVNLGEDSRALIRWFATLTPMRYHGDGLSFLPRPNLHEVINCDHYFSINRKEANVDFVNAKREYGSVIAYHGSPTHNWHAILEHNLQNFSNTKQMTSGALFGSGIYLTSAISLSRSFSKMGSTSDKSALGTSLSCVGVFEIAVHPEYVRSEKGEESSSSRSPTLSPSGTKVPKHYYVVKDNRYIEMRGMLVWSETKEIKAKKTKFSFWMILIYVAILVAMCLSQMKWDRVRKQTWRYLHNFVA